MLPVHREAQGGNSPATLPILFPGRPRSCVFTQTMRQPEAKPRFLEVLDEAPQEADRKGRRREADSLGWRLNLAQGRL